MSCLLLIKLFLIVDINLSHTHTHTHTHTQINWRNLYGNLHVIQMPNMDNMGQSVKQ